jgi:predicted DNA-binding protein YlxM (UPF0122 family)
MKRDLRLRLNKKELQRLYLEEKRSLEDIARLYGVSRVAIWKHCRAEGLMRRNRSEARLEAQKRGKVPQNYYAINENFFSKWFPEMAYVLGLIATDGCVSKTGTISLCINDKDLLKKVKTLLSSDHPIKYYGYQEGLYSFSFSREKLVTDLNKLGILPKKSLNILFPDVPDRFLADFIRGVFDGGGSVFYEKRSNKFPLRSSFVSSSKKFIKILENKLRMLGLPERNIYQEQKKNSISYMIRYCHADSIKLFRILYEKAVKDGLFLRRKYNKFAEVINRAKQPA